MWQPSFPGSIPVSLKVADWSWSASAAYDAINGWSLTSTNLTVATPQDTQDFPMWTNTILPGITTTNTIP
jgi:hypothetical protein